MLSGFMVPDPFAFIFMNFITGMAAIFTLTNIYRKGKALPHCLYNGFYSYSAFILGLLLMKDGNFQNIDGF